MNILVLTASLSRMAGGLFESVRQPIQQLVKSGRAEVHVFGLEDEHTHADLPAWGGVPVRAFPVKGPRAFGFAPGLLAATRAANPDLVQTEGLWMYPSWACLQWARATGKPYVVRPRGMLDTWALRNSRWKKCLAAWAYQDAHLYRAACLLALCEAEAEAIRGHGLRNPIAVVPNGIDLSGECPVARDAQPSAGRKQLLYLGRLHPKKGLPDLLRAWQSVQRLGMADEWELLIAGWDQGGHEAELRTLCHDAGLQNHVRFLGPRFGADKEAAYRTCDAFVLPSLSEGLPMVVLEAWAYGLPVLMTPECHLPEGFAAGAAIRIDPEPESIARGLAVLFAMGDGERKEMGLRGRKLVEERFTWARVASELHAVHRWVLGGGERPACVRLD